MWMGVGILMSMRTSQNVLMTDILFLDTPPAKHNGGCVYGGSDGYTGDLLSTIPTGGDGTERDDDPDCSEEDNKACISFSDRYHFVKEGVQRGDISMEYIET